MADQSAPPPKEIYAHYTGGGYSGYLAGLGACDLTRQEWDEAEPALTALALDLKLYTLADASPVSEPAAPAVESAA